MNRQHLPAPRTGRAPAMRPDRYSHNYPTSASDVFDPRRKFKPAVLRVVRAFARSKPWRGTLAERRFKFAALIEALSLAYNIPAPRVMFSGGNDDQEFSGTSSYHRETHTITLRGRLSVVTTLHEFAHALGWDEAKAVGWSTVLFARCFPRSFANVFQAGHCLIRLADPRTILPPPGEADLLGMTQDAIRRALLGEAGRVAPPTVEQPRRDALTGPQALPAPRKPRRPRLN